MPRWGIPVDDTKLKEKVPVNCVALIRLTSKLSTVKTRFDCTLVIKIKVPSVGLRDLRGAHISKFQWLIILWSSGDILFIEASNWM